MSTPRSFANAEEPLILLKSLLYRPALLKAMLEDMRDGVMICNEQGHILFVNEAIRHITGQLNPKIIPDEALTGLIQSVLESGKAVTEELNLWVGKQKHYFQVHIVPILIPIEGENEDVSQQIKGCMATFHEITAIRKTEKMRRDFVANVSHELRTPLSALKGYAETLLDGALEDKAVSRDFVEIILKHSQRLSQLVEDLLDLSKLESPDYVADLDPMDLKFIVQHVYAMNKQHIEQKELNLTIELPETLPKVLGNVSHLEQVLTNLLDNAIKYTPAKGNIRLSANLNDEQMVQVDVTDTGIGIDSKHLPRVFERFYRVDKARSRDMGGTGLGLSIVKHIIQIHGGDIWVESKSNQGSTFSFTLKPA